MLSVTGCIGYRGCFDQADAPGRGRLAAQGLEVEVYGVPAYSTLGYMNWAGDPLLSTFIAWPEGEFVRLLFHELAHQVVYASGDTCSADPATAVGRLGSASGWPRRPRRGPRSFCRQRSAAQPVPRTDTGARAPARYLYVKLRSNTQPSALKL